MLGGVRLRLSYSHERSCFAYINNKYSSNSEQNQCIQVLYKDRKVLLWVVFSSNIPDGQIACNPMFSRLLGLDEGLDVFVSPYPGVKVLDELYIDTDSPEDQEILEHNAELLQLRILDQLRLVAANQKAVVWISVSLPIVFTPKQTGVLMNQSKIVVKVDAFNSFRGMQQSKSIDLPQEEEETSFNNIGIVIRGMLKPYVNVPKREVFRAIPIDSDGKKHLVHPYTVFIHEDFVCDKFKDGNTNLATIQAIPSILKEPAEENTEKENNDLLNHYLCVEIVAIDHIVFRSLSREVYNRCIPTVLISKSLNNIVNIENGMKMMFTWITDDMEQPERIHIVTYSDNVEHESDIIAKFKNCVVESINYGKKFLINNGMVKQNKQISSGYLQFQLQPEKIKYALLNLESLRQCTISAKCLSDAEFPGIKPTNVLLDIDYNNYCRTMKSQEVLIEKVMSHLYFEMHREACFKGVSEIKSNVLVTGLSGMGKSALCHIVQKELTVWSHVVHCRTLKGRKDIPEALGKAILMCQEHSPSVLICDDIDSLVPPSLEGASPQDIAYYQRLAVVIKHLLQTCTGVSVLMTSLSVNTLHPTLKQFSGKPMFTAHFNILELGQLEREELLKFLLNEKVYKEFDIAEDDVVRMAMDTAGHNVRDLVDYLNRKIFKAVKKKNACADMKPRLVEDITNDTEKLDAFDIWGPVGGMDAVKEKLTEYIFWPIMYPALFPSQSCGILLYGPPGTGKSYIGSSLAKLYNMNFIAVKGPELLSKYIGQSEKAVRDIFDKADMKRPCILFFDEFDSLAPKRGHDSTGVTDRVVNQLLARLDGAEGGARGPVLAATARPDLLDPALLRPGRLHHHLYCAPPDRRGRVEVLRTLAKSVNVSEDVDLEEVAARTEGFSPADLKALLVTAQLGRLENQLESSEDNMESVVVDLQDIENALSETKPSLSREQRIFYDTIYKRFRGESVSPEQRRMSFQKQKVTLA